MHTGIGSNGLPYVFLGIGSGCAGVLLSNLISLILTKRHPEILVQKKVEAEDERNLMITRQSKSKAYNLYHYGIAILLLLYAALDVKFNVVLPLVVLYILTIAYRIFTAYHLSQTN